MSDVLECQDGKSEKSQSNDLEKYNPVEGGVNDNYYKVLENGRGKRSLTIPEGLC